MGTRCQRCGDGLLFEIYRREYHCYVCGKVEYGYEPSKLVLKLNARSDKWAAALIAGDVMRGNLPGKTKSEKAERRRVREALRARQRHANQRNRRFLQ